MSEDFFEEIKQPRRKAKRVGFSIEEKVVIDFNNICEAKDYNKSKLIEGFMKKFVEQELSLIK